MVEKKLIDSFIEQVRESCDFDYGDFMRRMNLYISNLKEQFINESAEIREKLKDMQIYTQFAANWNIEITRARLMNDAGTIRNWLYQNYSHPPLVQPQMA
jgi:hypothetical protein